MGLGEVLGLVVQNSKGNRGKVPDAGSLGGEQVSWLVRGVWKEGQGTCVLKVSLTSPSSLQGLSIPPSSSWAVLVNIPVF